jgi:hypothetical protein
MRDIDKKLVTDVTAALMRVRDANLRKSSVSLAHGDEKPVEASVVLTRDAIREQTRRNKLRDVVIDEIQSAFSKQYGVEVTRTNNNNLIIKTVPIERESEFNSLNELFDGASRAKKYLADTQG